MRDITIWYKVRVVFTSKGSCVERAFGVGELKEARAWMAKARKRWKALSAEIKLTYTDQREDVIETWRQPK